MSEKRPRTCFIPVQIDNPIDVCFVVVADDFNHPRYEGKNVSQILNDACRTLPHGDKELSDEDKVIVERILRFGSFKFEDQLKDDMERWYGKEEYSVARREWEVDMNNKEKLERLRKALVAKNEKEEKEKQEWVEAPDKRIAEREAKNGKESTELA